MLGIFLKHFLVTKLFFLSEDWKKVYLVFYNLGQFVGFLYILVVMALRYSRDGPNSIPSTYANVGNVMKLCTLFQILEIMHPMFGYTRNSVLAPLLQVVNFLREFKKKRLILFRYFV